MNVCTLAEQSALTLVDIVELKWMLAGEGLHVHVEKLQSDPCYARECLLAAERSENATVRQVARDAVQDEHRGPLYPVRLTLARRSLTVDGHEAPIGPGLSGSAEIVTGERRLIDYVLSPLLRHGHESLHER